MYNSFILLITGLIQAGETSVKINGTVVNLTDALLMFTPDSLNEWPEIELI